MKILFVLPESPSPANNGNRIKTNTMMSALIEEHECDLLFFSNDIEKDIALVRKEMPQVQRIEGCAPNKKFRRAFNLLSACFINRCPGINKTYSKKMLKKVKDFSKQKKYDLIIYDMIGSYLYNDKSYKCAKILSVNDAISLSFERKNAIENNFLRRIYNRLIFKTIRKVEKTKYNDYDFITLVSDVDLETMLKINNKANYKVIPIMVDDRYFVEKNVKQNTLFFSGNLALPGISEGLFDFLENGYLEVVEKVPDVKFLINAWNASEEEVLKIKQYPNVTYRGFIENSEHVKILSDMKVTIVPDKSGTGLKNRVLQAFAAQVAVVGSKFAFEGFPYVNKVHAFCEGTVQDMSKRIIELFNNPDMLNKTCLSALEITKEYRSPIVFKQWQNLVDSAIKKKINV